MIKSDDTDGNQVKYLFFLGVVDGVSHTGRPTPSSPRSINNNSPSTGRGVGVLIILSVTRARPCLKQTDVNVCLFMSMSHKVYIRLG